MRRGARLDRYARVAGATVCAALWLILVVAPHYNDTSGWYFAGVVDPYAIHLKTQSGAFIYSPAFTQAMEPVRALPLEVVYALLVGVELAFFAWATGPWAIPVLILLGVTGRPDETLPGEFWYGQINLLLVAAAIAGLRWPSAWAFVLLTKVTPAVGLLWYPFRGEWRNLAIALGTTAGIVLVSAVLAPGLWAAWFGVLRDNAGTPMPGLYIPLPLWSRLAMAALLLAWAAPRNQRWALAVAVTLGTAWLAVAHLVMLVGAIPFLGDLRRLRWRAGTASATPRPEYPGS